MVRKKQIRKLPHLRKVRKSKKIKSAKFADLRFADMFADRPPLLFA
jgi:hypothetical protein